jgi:hypothetical protein
VAFLSLNPYPSPFEGEGLRDKKGSFVLLLFLS